MQLHIHNLIDEEKCYSEIRAIRWKYAVCCSRCGSNKVRKRGKNHRHPAACQRSECNNCHKRFDDLTGTVFAKRHQSLSVWIVFVYLLGLNLSNNQIAQELVINQSDSQYMAEILRKEVVNKKEVYIVAGHKGQPDAIKDRKPRRNRLKGARGRGTLEKEGTFK